MSSNPKISVIIPLYNHEKYIREAVYSVLEQSIQDFELIIINDGSRDKSEEVVKSIKDDRIKYFYQENQGAHNTINRGIQLAQGEYVSILNSDDVYYRNRFEEALKVLESDSSVQAVFSHLEFIDEKGEFIRYYRGAEDFWTDCNPGIPYKDTNDIVLDLLAGNFLITTSNLFCRRTVFKDIGDFLNLKYTHDYEFYLRLCSSYKVCIIDQPLMKYRVHALNTLKKNEAELSFEVGLVLTNFLLNYDIDNIFKEGEERYNALLRLFNIVNTYHSDKMMMMLLLYVMKYKGGREDVFKELTDNIENPFRKGCIDSFNGVFEMARNLAERDRQIAERDRQIAERDRQIAEKDSQIAEKDSQIAEKDSQIQRLLNSYSWKITKPLRIGYRLYKGTKYTAFPNITPYHARLLHSPNKYRKRIVHALGNFLTGGSSRLVVDLIEHLGHLYEQEIITCLKPEPSHYMGVVIHEFNYMENMFNNLILYFEKFNPDIIHIHYWGEKDEEWYKQVFAAAQKKGCKIIENINTPVRPYFIGAVNKYVYVSEYVQNTFGQHNDKSLIIYPGSNFDMFNRPEDTEIPDDCIGMVYRLEPDKLNENSIDVFIKVAKLRPGIKILIVGGGSLYDIYKKSVSSAGVGANIEFTGYVPYENLPKYYKKMNIFVAPVWKESFGQVSPFAMNMGIPVVGYDIGALYEIIGDKGLLAPPGDSDRLADIIIALLDSKEKRRSIGNRNRQRAKELFSVESMIRSYDGLYKDLLKK